MNNKQKLVKIPCMLVEPYYLTADTVMQSSTYAMKDNFVIIWPTLTSAVCVHG